MIPTAFMVVLIATASIAIAPVAAASLPDAVDDGTALAPFQFFPEDAPATAVDVIANDTGPDGLTSTGLTITGKTDGAHGIVAIDAGMRFVTYTPNAEDSGADSFTYTVSDGSTTDTATVYVSINALNDAPSFTLGPDPTRAEDSGAATVTGFAVGSVGPPVESAQKLNYVITGNTNAALFSVQPAFSPADAKTQDLTFTPALNQNGSATITVHAEDSGPNGGGDVNFSPPQTFVITVTPVNDAPVAVADGTYQVKQGTALVVPALTGVLANDTDIDSSHSALTAVVNTSPAHGTLTLNLNGSFTYTPTASYVGADSFTYHANDGALNSNVVTASLNVYADQAPVAVNDDKTVVAGSPFTALDVLTNDTAANPDSGETLTITLASDPAHGSVVITGGGTGLSYRPDSGFFGTDTFSYTISDGVLTATGTVTVHVLKDTFKPVATAPVQAVRGQAIGSSTVRVHLAWSGTDIGTGIRAFEVWQSTNGHAYRRIKTTTALGMTFTGTVGTTYRFRVRAIDKAGNIGRYVYGPSFKVVRLQENSARYTGPWTYLTNSHYSRNHDRRTATIGATATLRTTGRTFSWVAVKGASRGTADVYVDGVLKAHVTLTASSTTYRYVVYSITFATSGLHTLRIVDTGPAGKRVDVDAFIVLR